MSGDRWRQTGPSPRRRQLAPGSAASGPSSTQPDEWAHDCGAARPDAHQRRAARRMTRVNYVGGRSELRAQRELCARIDATFYNQTREGSLRGSCSLGGQNSHSRLSTREQASQRPSAPAAILGRQSVERHELLSEREHRGVREQRRGDAFERAAAACRRGLPPRPAAANTTAMQVAAYSGPGEQGQLLHRPARVPRRSRRRWRDQDEARAGNRSTMSASSFCATTCAALLVVLSRLSGQLCPTGFHVRWRAPPVPCCRCRSRQAS